METADILVAPLPRQRMMPAVLWTVAGAVALLLAQALGIVAYVMAVRLTSPGQALPILAILENPLAMAGSTVLSTPLMAAFFWGLARLRTPLVAEYLALRWPSLRALGISVLACLAFDAVLYLLPPNIFAMDDRFVGDMVSAAQAAGGLPLVAIALIVAAPICEELAFRGFLYRTLEEKFGATLAIMVTALGWAALHVQYDVAGLTIVFGSGLLLGTIRRHSGSLYLTMILHGIWNSVALAGALTMGTGPRL